MNFAFPLRRSPAPRSQQRGAFSLLEVAIALVIFVIGAIALLRIFPTGLNVLEHSGNRRTAAQMSQNVLKSYDDKGELAASKPDAIFDGDLSNTSTPDWHDYPLSMMGNRNRDKGTVPETQDDFGTSAAGHLRFIRGEKQSVLGGSFLTNYVVDRRKVNVYRQETVENVGISSDGQLDFRSATYKLLGASRQTIASSATNIKFRQPVFNLDEVFANSAGPNLAPTNGVLQVTRNITTQTFDLHFDIDNNDGVANISGITLPTGYINVGSSDCSLSRDMTSETATRMAFKLSVPPILTPTAQANQVLTISFDTGSGVSLSRSTYYVFVQGDGTGPSAPAASPLLRVRAPNVLRAGATYYVSYQFPVVDGVSGVSDQPMTFDATDINYSQSLLTPSTQVSLPFIRSSYVPSVIANNSAVILIRQFLGGFPGQNDRIKIQMLPSPPTEPPSYADVNGSFTASDLTKVSLDYNVYDWTYLTEFADQFGTPFPGDNQPIPATATSADEAIWRQFASDAPTTPGSFTRGDLRELRTSVGNLRGPIYIKGIYNNGSGDAYSMDTQFDPRDPPTAGYGSSDNAEKKAFRKRMADAAKQGRFYLPAQTSQGTLQKARLYYRSRDNWAQQIGVAASHYLPFNSNYVGKPEREPWREYFVGTGNKLYFHAAEAGKTVHVTYSGGGGDDLEIDSHPISYATEADLTMATGVPANFAIAYPGDPENANDPKKNRFFVCSTRDKANGNIIDVGRVGSGVFVRTLWLDSGRYAQEAAPTQ